MKKIFLLLLSVLLCFSLCACSTESGIVGTWCEGDEIVLVFTDDGKCYSEEEGRTYDYIIQDDFLILTDSWRGSSSIEYSLSKNTLELIYDSGTTIVLKRQ